MSGAGASGSGGGGSSYGSLAGFDKGSLDSMLLAPVDFDNLPMFQKNFYVEHADVVKRTEEEITAYRAVRSSVANLLCGTPAHPSTPHAEARDHD